MNIRFGTVPVSAIQKGAKLLDHQTNQEATITYAHRDNPDAVNHGPLFMMMVGLDGNEPEWVDIAEGEQVHRFSKIG